MPATDGFLPGTPTRTFSSARFIRFMTGDTVKEARLTLLDP